jgi:hypothetical protein
VCIDQYISAGSSLAAFLAALATFLTVWQIAKQRRATYRPEIIVMRGRVLTTDDLKNPDLQSLLNWKRSDMEEDTRTYFLGRKYPLFLVNIGMGAATNVSAAWYFPLEAFIAYGRQLENARGYPVDIEYRKGTVSIGQPPISFEQRRRFSTQKVNHEMARERFLRPPRQR